MGSARKPVIVRKFSREWYAGYAGAAFGQESPALEVLDLTGKVLTIGWEAVKWVCYVRDFSSSSDQANPERLLQKKFTVRPRAAGLWLRMTLNDGDELEGIAANDRSLVTGCRLAGDPAGYPLEYPANLHPPAGHPSAGGGGPDRGYRAEAQAGAGQHRGSARALPC